MNRILLLALIGASVVVYACQPGHARRRDRIQVLMYTEAGQAGDTWVQDLLLAAQAADMTVRTTTDRRALHLDSLSKYSVLVLAGARPDAFRPVHTTAIEAYVQAGGGLVSLGSPLTRPYTWPWYEPIGMPDTIPAAFRAHKTRSGPGAGWVQRAYDGGHIAIFQGDPATVLPESFQAQFAAVLRYTAGDNQVDLRRIRTRLAPADNRFTRSVLSAGLDEPMELTVLPDGVVLFIERKGAFKRYDPVSGQTQTLKTVPVCTTGNYEDGMLGITADPHFADNHYIYLYYSPACDLGVQRLSRFTMWQTDSVIWASEKVILDVPVQRETCCHSGGSLTFGPDGCLYLSTGDNTDPGAADGYAPLDERPGRAPQDAQKSAGNTHDLRGKVLRIRPTPYGGYSIPAGNLFPADGTRGRPEIYAMGMRNPFRISVDARRGWLYWGDVGPESTVPGRYGPETYDEINQCREPGFYGWPYFVGPNRAYTDRDFAADTVGAAFDPASPVNYSPHNTGARVLPPARPAFLAYTKPPMQQYPMLGAGSSTAMAGPVYYPPAAGTSSTAFPAYFEGVLFIYEWARSWIQAVTLDSAGNPYKIEPFLPDMPLSKPIDMEFGPDGSMYLLEYGKDYFLKNPEARLVRITYAAGNRAPVPSITLDRPAGAAPHTVQASAAGSFDHDERDSLTYEWFFVAGQAPQATGREARFTFSQPGTYPVQVRVRDAQGGVATAEATVHVGNAPPAVTIHYAGNQSFFFPGETVGYQVQIQDAEDEAAGGIRPQNTSVIWQYVDHPGDAAAHLGGTRPADHAASLVYAAGLQQMQASDCMSCHAMDHYSAGPGYVAVAQRYAGQPGAADQLVAKIYNGGSGNWGNKLMPGHPQHTHDEIRVMVQYILSLADNQGLPAQGSLTASRAYKPGGAYLLAATYTDQGGGGQPPISQRETRLLRHPRLQAEEGDEKAGLELFTVGINRDIASMASYEKGWIRYDQLDLHEIRQALIQISSYGGGLVSLRLDSLDGPKWGQIRLLPGPSTTLAANFEVPWKQLSIPLSPMTGRHDVYLIMEPAIPGQLSLVTDWVEWKK
ncbi:MAG: PQQ-dependent sugar dehydrogenase [Bacteroidia bacterium]|nr:PQQ-dependent sugar dehydrogenase [Bacteroidia bacterium]